MSGRAEALLTQLVEFQHRQIALLEAQLQNQRIAIDGQNAALEISRIAMDRQKRYIRVAFSAMAVVGAMIVVPYVYQWIQYLSHTP
jgi:hypothetical protein